MISWFTIIVIVIAVAAGLFCVVAGVAGRRPSDISVGGLALIEVLLIAQVVMAIVAPLVGNSPRGDPLEFWVYLISAVLLPLGGVIWALLDRSRWSTVILGIIALSIAIMMWRMQVIWTLQVV